MHTTTRLLATLAILLVPPAQATTELVRHAISCGGQRVAAGDVVLRGTIGQPASTRVLTGGTEHGSGFWGLASEILALDGAASTPSAFVLEPNRPNPFRTHTTIRFGVPEDTERVRLRVYDLAGRHVRTLVDGPVAAGFRSVTWDRRDAAGRRVSAGVYFSALEVPTASERRKLTVLR